MHFKILIREYPPVCISTEKTSEKYLILDS